MKHAISFFLILSFSFSFLLSAHAEEVQSDTDEYVTVEVEAIDNDRITESVSFEPDEPAVIDPTPVEELSEETLPEQETDTEPSEPDTADYADVPAEDEAIVLPDEAETPLPESSDTLDGDDAATADKPTDTIPAEPVYTLVIPQFSGINYMAEDTYIGDLFFTDVGGLSENTAIRITAHVGVFTNDNGAEIPYSLLINYSDGSTETISSGSDITIDCSADGSRVLLKGISDRAAIHVLITPAAWASAEGGSYNAELTFSAETVSASE